MTTKTLDSTKPLNQPKENAMTSNNKIHLTKEETEALFAELNQRSDSSTSYHILTDGELEPGFVDEEQDYDEEEKEILDNALAAILAKRVVEKGNQ